MRTGKLLQNQLTYFYPSSETWKQNDREIVCLIGGASGTSTTGTLKGAAK